MPIRCVTHRDASPHWWIAPTSSYLWWKTRDFRAWLNTCSNSIVYHPGDTYQRLPELIRDLPELYSRVSTKLAEKLKGAPALSFTTDIWHSDVCPMSYLPEERSLFQPHIESTIMMLILKQTEFWYRNSIGISRYPNSGIGIGSEVKKCG